MIGAIFKSIIGNWQVSLGLAGAFALWSTAIYFVGRDHGYDLRVSEQAQARVKADKLEEKSAGEAAIERENDTGEISDNQKERDDAIRNETDDKPSDASNALMCERMRRAGRDIRQLPACSGRSD